MSNNALLDKFLSDESKQIVVVGFATGITLLGIIVVLALVVGFFIASTVFFGTAGEIAAFLIILLGFYQINKWCEYYDKRGGLCEKTYQ